MASCKRGMPSSSKANFRIDESLAFGCLGYFFTDQQSKDFSHGDEFPRIPNDAIVFIEEGGTMHLPSIPLEGSSSFLPLIEISNTFTSNECFADTVISEELVESIGREFSRRPSSR